jgi:hypothetical protein
MACELSYALPSNMKSTLPIIPTCNPQSILMAGADVDDYSDTECNDKRSSLATLSRPGAIFWVLDFLGSGFFGFWELF